jgi:hypothetical protein
MSLLQRALRSPLTRNRVGLEAKFLSDRLRGRDRFRTHGQRIQPLERPASAIPTPKNVLFPTQFYLDRALGWQCTIAKALEVRGHRVTFLPQNLVFPRRNTLYFDEPQGSFSPAYYNRNTQAVLESFRFSVHPYGEFGSTERFAAYRVKVANLDHAACRAFTDRGLPIGAMAENSVMHFFRCGPERWTERMLEAYRDYLAIGMVLRDALEQAFDALKPDVVFTLNGSFLDTRLHLALAHARGIRVVTFEAGFMLNSLMLGVDESIVDFPMTKYLPPDFSDYTLTPAQDSELDRYLAVRRVGKESVFDYWGDSVLDHDRIRHELGLAPGVVPDILFTNLLWDSAMLDCDIGFSSQREWILETIAFYRSNPQRALLLRIHPAEVTPPHLESADKIKDWLSQLQPSLPPNVAVIPPTSTISSYPLMEISNRVHVYSSTAGLEAATLGKPVIVAGRCHYRGQGFTVDPDSRDAYNAMLGSSTFALDSDVIRTRSRRYAYFFFFGFNIPFPLVTERATNVRGEPVSFNFTREDALLPGKEPNLDFVLDVVLGKRSYRDRLAELIA